MSQYSHILSISIYLYHSTFSSFQITPIRILTLELCDDVSQQTSWRMEHMLLIKKITLRQSQKGALNVAVDLKKY